MNTESHSDVETEKVELIETETRRWFPGPGMGEIGRWWSKGENFQF